VGLLLPAQRFGASSLFSHKVGVVDAPAGTTVFVPAGSPHAYWETEPSRHLIFLTPRLDRLISRLHRLTDRSQLPAILAKFDTVLVEERAN